MKTFENQKMLNFDTFSWHFYRKLLYDLLDNFGKVVQHLPAGKFYYKNGKSHRRFDLKLIKKKNPTVPALLFSKKNHEKISNSKSDITKIGNRIQNVK